jgi:phosphate/sulfate permease
VTTLRRIRTWVRSFAEFWYDFVVGDDWRIAVGVVAGLLITYGVSQTSAPAWWILPVGVAVFLGASLWIAGRRSRADSEPPRS